MKGNAKTRILIVDDHQMFRDVLAKLINGENDMEVIGKAENGQKAVELTRKLQPDIILMDVKMPVMDGIEATSKILAEMPGMKILALSMYSGAGFNSGIMRAGALGYILKGGEFEELVGIIRKMAGSRSR